MTVDTFYYLILLLLNIEFLLIMIIKEDHRIFMNICYRVLQTLILYTLIIIYSNNI